MVLSFPLHPSPARLRAPRRLPRPRRSARPGLSPRVCLPPMENAADITGWIRDWQQGDALARDRVFAQLYAELKRLAAVVLRSESGHDTLQPTALLNDALIKLIEAQKAPAAEDRGHFARIVARAMRQILVDRARRKLADKRGAGVVPESLDAGLEIPLMANPAELVALDDALATLGELDPRAAAVVELRVFAGLTIDEAAQALDISPSSVNREWAHACAWLKNDIFTPG